MTGVTLGEVYEILLLVNAESTFPSFPSFIFFCLAAFSFTTQFLLLQRLFLLHFHRNCNFSFSIYAFCFGLTLWLVNTHLSECQLVKEKHRNKRLRSDRTASKTVFYFNLLRSGDLRCGARPRVRWGLLHPLHSLPGPLAGPGLQQPRHPAGLGHPSPLLPG